MVEEEEAEAGIILKDPEVEEQRIGRLEEEEESDGILILFRCCNISKESGKGCGLNLKRLRIE